MTKTIRSGAAPAVRRRTLLAAGLGGVLTAPAMQALAAPAAASSASNDFSAAGFDAWAERVAAERMRHAPEHATRMQYFQGEVQARLDGQWDSLSREDELADIARDRRALAELARFPRDALSPTQRTSAALMAWTMRQNVAEGEFLDHPYVFEHMAGVHVGPITFLVQEHPMRNAADVRSYLQRMDGLAALMDQGIVRARAAQAKGMLMPRFITATAVGQIEQFVAPKPADNPLVVSLAERMATLPDMDDAARQRARARAEAIVANSIVPAWRRGLALLRAQLPRTTDDAGVWRLPDGDRFYAARLRANTTTELSPAEIHAIGLKQVARIEAEMDGLLRQLGYAEGSIEQRYRKMDADRQPKDAAPQVQLLDRYTTYLRDAQARARLLFDVMPKAPVEVRREPALTEPTAAAHYTTPAPDGSQPGVFWAPLAGPTYDIADMRTLVHHEAIPGHHFQLAIQMEARDLPYFRRRAAFSAGSAYVEGWALYAEQLAVENGWYDGDPVGHLGQLYGALFRARRLVVDTGLHAMKWTRQQAIDYGITPQEVDRYVTWPGQACAYMLGRLRIEALRERARQQLGDRFDIKQFHNTVLLTGDVPLTVLEQVVDDWVGARRVAGSSTATAAP
ncbi:uncharacterized protein (DUF885 family) [Mitsuaria sp. BK045]|uniref:DUF885 domain-containing protein n=1 Tax=unclassified Roseateles TaxID=2626991 RepID=UPI0017FDC6A0|nr:MULTISPECIES: DUF885 domain-containing protein [unclassified Roseateles]MBB3295227.1 uncharacterized protein (DUF885 family) [Mitsuaria sp. BK041]MBB3364443.1 uncharacterized protein (DUF885 family) [Mitsuaria sp. BK045]